MIVAINTIERPNKTPYIDRLIESIRKDYSGEIHLVVGGKDMNYLDKYTDGFIKHFTGDQEAKLETVSQKAALGYYTALTLDRNQSLLRFEDDGVLVNDWYDQLRVLQSFIGDDRYALSLLSPSREAVTEPDIQVSSIQKYVYHSFLSYGTPGQLPTATVVTYSNTTGIFYPTSLLQTRLPEFIEQFAVQGQALYDIIFGQYMFRYNLPIYIAVPNLMQFAVDSTDSSLGSEKKMAAIDYSAWDFTKL